MSVFSFLSAMACTVYLFLGYQALRAGHGSPVNRLFAYTCLCLGLGSGTYAFLISAASEEQAWFWYRLSVPGWTLAPALMLHVLLLLGEQTRATRNRWLMAVIYAPAILFLMRGLTGVVDASGFVRGPLGWMEVPAGGFWAVMFALYYMGYIAVGLTILYRWGRRNGGTKATQARIIITTGLVAVGLVALTNNVLPACHVVLLPSIGAIEVSVWAMGIWYAMQRYGLMRMTAATAADEILATMNDGVLLVDPTNRVIRVNPAAVHLLESNATQLVGKDVKDVLPGKDVSATQVLRQTDGGHADWLQETTLVTPSNRQLPLAISTSTVRDSLGQVLGVVMILRDISKQKENEEKLRMLAHHDALTQLPNRLLLRDRMTVATARARRYKHAVAVLLLDLDHFKEINDTLGHDYGDEVLRLFAARLLGCVRGHDTVARLGGDEFVIVAGELPEPATAEVVARRILSASERPLEVKGRQIFVTPSIGISVYQRDAESVEDLLRLADIAMYESKNRQRNTFTFFEAAMLLTVNKRAEEQADARGGSM